MTAPLPLRFYNPVKGLCEKVNLDYETVIGTGLRAKMREVDVLADIPKELKDIDKTDRKRAQHKIDFLNKKYGGADSKTGTGEGEGCPDRHRRTPRRRTHRCRGTLCPQTPADRLLGSCRDRGQF